MVETAIQADRALRMLAGLTSKQVEVLDLLLMHRTTKEIARELEIAPNTVDQRIAGVREKWGTSNRKDTARLYSELLELCGKTTCGNSRVASDPFDADSETQDLPVDPHFVLSDARPLGRFEEWGGYVEETPVGLEAFDRKFGRAGRFVAILVLALVLAMTLASSLSIAEALGRLV